MPQIRYTQRMGEDLARLSAFLQENAPNKIDEAMQKIFDKIEMLINFPDLGNLVPNEKYPNLRQLVIPYGKAGYVALYNYDKGNDLIIMETIRHSRELEPDFFKKNLN